MAVLFGIEYMINGSRVKEIACYYGVSRPSDGSPPKPLHMVEVAPATIERHLSEAGWTKNGNLLICPEHS